LFRLDLIGVIPKLIQHRSLSPIKDVFCHDIALLGLQLMPRIGVYWLYHTQEPFMRQDDRFNRIYTKGISTGNEIWVIAKRA
jgi:hypothetical protein